MGNYCHQTVCALTVTCQPGVNILPPKNKTMAASQSTRRRESRQMLRNQIKLAGAADHAASVRQAKIGFTFKTLERTDRGTDTDYESHHILTKTVTLLPFIFNLLRN